MTKKYNPATIEPKWQQKWETDQIYAFDPTNEHKAYVLSEFAYPSGDLHMGHWFTWSGADIYARFKRMQGFNVFFPNGFDAFGLPAEGAAIKHNVHPKDWTYQNIASMKEQYKLMGASFSFDHEVITCDPEYYKWNQWIFLKMYERGIAYKANSLSNWCPSCKTVLANEAVDAGKCWRCGSEVVQKEISQWFLKITEYADRLIWPDNSTVDWPKSVKEGQNNWIGRSQGVEIDFLLDGREEKITVYTVYPETIYGVTYLVIAPEHLLADELTTEEQKATVSEYIKSAQRKSELERKTAEKDKTGVFTGSYVINPVNGAKVPVWVADYVIGSYGTGAVMGVPGSDDRDFEFAQKYDLPIIRVIGSSKDDTGPVESADQVLEEGYLVNSEQFSGLKTPQDAKAEVINHLVTGGWARPKTQFHLHDWSIGRQRYWGTPIPMINCPSCGMVPVPESALPVELPYEVDITPTGKPPLATAEEWMKVECPQCGGPAEREAETMDTFFDSSWYFLRYLDPHLENAPFESELANKMLPVDIYFGGAEHTLGHTLYARFFTKFFFDLGMIKFDEFAQKRVGHGIILGPDGNKMSKSKGNVVNPDVEVGKYGADTVRTFLAFFMPFDGVSPWLPERINGVHRFLTRVWALSDKVVRHPELVSGSTLSEPTKDDLHQLHRTIAKVTADTSTIKYNTAVASLMEWLNYLAAKAEVTQTEFEVMLQLLSPYAPHLTEELWHELGHNDSIHTSAWPLVNDAYLEASEIIMAVQINGKLRGTVTVPNDAVEETVMAAANENPAIAKHLAGETIKKTIFVPGKILNLIV